MLAVAGEPPTGPGWTREIKWDGYRGVAYVQSGRLRLLSRNGNALLGQFPELEVLAAVTAGHTAVFDGEIVAIGPDGRPSFASLQQRRSPPTPAVLARSPVHYYVFDLLYLDGRSLLAAPYWVRRQLLAELELPGVDPRVQVPPNFPDGDPEDLWKAVIEFGFEGIVSKRSDSPYLPNVRSRAWIKSPRQETQTAVIGGWVPGNGGRAATFGSLLLGAHDEAGRLVYIGRVGAGLSEHALRDLRRQLDGLATQVSPFAGQVPREHARDARWVRPVLLGEVAFRSWTTDRRLRQPAWKGLRPDLSGHDAVLPA